MKPKTLVDLGVRQAERDEYAIRKAEKKKGGRLSAAEVRQLIDTEDNLRAIQLLIARLEVAGTYQIVVDPHSGEKQETLLPPIDPTPIKAALDARFKLLNKVLPDLKSVEHTGEVQTGLSELLKLAAERSAQHRSIEREIPGEVVAPEKLDFF
jgi:hypothetical protein